MSQPEYTETIAGGAPSTGDEHIDPTMYTTYCAIDFEGSGHVNTPHSQMDEIVAIGLAVVTLKHDGTMNPTNIQLRESHLWSLKRDLDTFAGFEQRCVEEFWKKEFMQPVIELFKQRQQDTAAVEQELSSCIDEIAVKYPNVRFVGDSTGYDYGMMNEFLKVHGKPPVEWQYVNGKNKPFSYLSVRCLGTQSETLCALLGDDGPVGPELRSQWAGSKRVRENLRQYAAALQFDPSAVDVTCPYLHDHNPKNDASQIAWMFARQVQMETALGKAIKRVILSDRTAVKQDATSQEVDE